MYMYMCMWTPRYTLVKNTGSLRGGAPHKLQGGFGGGAAPPNAPTASGAKRLYCICTCLFCDLSKLRPHYFSGLCQNSLFQPRP